jgi:fucose 4-O-acetylase-like acetyltransferase
LRGYFCPKSEHLKRDFIFAGPKGKWIMSSSDLAKRKSDIIYYAKGILILLVVIGHYHFAGYVPDYYLIVRKYIYKVHMPAFMMLAGILYCMKEYDIATWSQYKKFVGKKFKRLMVPYITVGSIVASLKYFLSQFYRFGHQVDEHFFYYFFFNPMARFSEGGGFAQFLWFLYTLFVIFCIFPILQSAVKNTALILLGFIVLDYYDITPYFCLDHVVKYIPFFIFGYMINKREEYFIFNRRFDIVFYFILFVLAIYFKSVSNSIMSLLIAFSAGVFILKASDIICSKSGVILGKVFARNSISAIGYYSSGIYLLHSIFMAVPVVLFYGFMKFGASSFFFAAPIAVFFGVFFSLLFTKHIVMRYGVLSRYILGAVKA